MALSLLALAGRFSPTLDLLTQLLPLLAAAAVAITTASAACRQAKATLISLMACGILLFVAAPELARSVVAQRVPAQPHDLILVQFNAWEYNLDPFSTAEGLLALNPDVITLEEAEGQGLIVRNLLERAGYRAPAACYRSVHRCRTIVLSRMAILGGDTLARAPLWLQSTYAQLGTGSCPLTVIATHPGWPWPLGRAALQRRELAKQVTRFAPSTSILAGDFNDSSWTYTTRAFDLTVQLHRLTTLLPTWPAQATTGVPFTPPFPFLALDQVYAGRLWSVVSIYAGPRLGSDHLPIVVRLRLKNAGPSQCF